MSASFGMFTNVLNKIIGAQVLADIQVFVASFDALFGGFRERAEATYAQEGTRYPVRRGSEPGGRRAARGELLRRTA